MGLDAVFSKDVRPLGGLRCGWVRDDPEATGLLGDGGLLGFSGRDLPALAQEADFTGFLDCPGVVDREVQIEEFGERRRPPTVACFRLALFNGLVGRQPGASGDVVLVMPLDLGCQQLVGLLPVADRFHGKKRGQSFLPEVELSLDLAL